MIGPITAFRRLCMLFGDEDTRNLFTVPKFAAAHKHMLVIIADPNTDRIFVSHRGKFVNGRIRSIRGKATHVVRDMMKQSPFKQYLIDQFIGSLVETLRIPLTNKAGNQFYSYLDGAIFGIAKALRADKKNKKGKQAAGPPAARGVLAPFQPAEGGLPDGED